MPGQVWKVVGGADKGGILVREGQSTTSPQVPDRLATGSLVKEVGLRGERLHYERLTGSGPPEGWVSLKLTDKVLLVKADDLQENAAAWPGGPFDAERLLERYTSGGLGPVVAEYRRLLEGMPLGPEMKAPREDGSPVPWEGYVPVADAGGRPKLVFVGDQLTQGPPLNVTAPYVAAVARRNPGLLVENAGWAASMSVAVASPQEFYLPLPKPGEYAAQYVCILVGTNDAIAMAGPEANIDPSFVGPPGGPFKLPADWREKCCPSVELFEHSVAAAVRGHKAGGARVVVATPPPLGEDVTDAIPEKHAKKLRRSPHAVVAELAAAVRRVAAAEGCDVLPLFECANHFLGKVQREPIIWTPQGFSVRLNAGMGARRHEAEKGLPTRLYSEFGAPNGRPELCFDLVHFNEDAAALFGALVQAWLDAQDP